MEKRSRIASSSVVLTNVRCEVRYFLELALDGCMLNCHIHIAIETETGEEEKKRKKEELFSLCCCRRRRHLGEPEAVLVTALVWLVGIECFNRLGGRRMLSLDPASYKDVDC